MIVCCVSMGRAVLLGFRYSDESNLIRSADPLCDKYVTQNVLKHPKMGIEILNRTDGFWRVKTQEISNYSVIF